MKILIADDEPIVRQGLRLIIKNSHIPSSKIIEAASGNEALKLARENSPDIALIDIKMPGLSGLEVIKDIKKFLPGLKTIIISAYDSFEYSRQALRYGASDFLVKPFNPEDVVHAICRCIQEKDLPVKEIGKKNEKEFFCPQSLSTAYDELVELVRLGNAPAVCYKTTEFFSGCLTDGLSHGLKVQAVEILMLVYRAASQRGADKEKIENICYEAICELLNASGTGSFFETLKESVYEISVLVPKKSVSSKEQLVSVANKYIHDNLNGELTLQDVAKHVHLSSAYFSSIFKQVTGRNFSEYTNELKIEAAKNLLLDNTLSIRYIARNVGFSDTSYFSRVFKKKTGLSPGLYRKRVTS